MRTVLVPLILAAALAIGASSPCAVAESQTLSKAPLPQLLKLIEDETKEKHAAAESIKTATDELAKLKAANAPADQVTALQNRLDIAQKRLNAAQERLDILTDTRAALLDQGPIQALIGELKARRDALPTGRHAIETRARAAIDNQISELEKADRALKAPSGLGMPAILVTAFGVLLLFVVGLAYLWFQASKPGKSEADDEAIARVRLAKAMTLGAMTFIVLVSVVTLLIAGVNAALAPQPESKDFFEIAKWVFATVLPVVAAWVGGVMAYYFGKENFKAGAENAERLVRQLTPQQKLQSLKASECGLAIDAAAVLRLTARAKLEDTRLQDIETAYTRGAKTYERLPILDDKGCVQACLHMSMLTKYKDRLTDADKADASKMTLGKLASSLPWTPEASIDTVRPTDDLSVVQAQIKARKECSDVFVTDDGTKSRPAQRWITNDDIVKIANA